MDEARRAGAEITRPAGDTFYGGYAGYFRVPRQTRLGSRVEPVQPSEGEPGIVLGWMAVPLAPIIYSNFN
jgi:hypothetical protein